MPSHYNNINPESQAALLNAPRVGSPADVAFVGPNLINALPDLVKGLGSGGVGGLQDILSIIGAMGGVGFGSKPQGVPSTDISRIGSRPFGADDLGRRMGADVDSNAFLLGDIGAPDPKDAVKLAASAPMAKSIAPLLAGMFGGRKAKNFDVNAMNQAEKMESAGADAETIWNDTGMFRGADGEWRFEISDEAATIWRNPKSETLEDTIYHPELYENYPQLRELRAADEKIDSQGLYRPPSSGYGGEVITQSGTTYPGRKSIALHETQHAIQEIEGFNKGTAPLDPNYDNLWDEIDSDAIGTVMQKYDIDGEYAPGESPAKWLGDRYREALDAGATLTELKPLRAEVARIANAERRLKLKAYEEYKLSAGEVEARNTELRRNWGEERRAENMPISTEDSPREFQTVNRSYDGEVFEPVRQNIYGDGKWYVVDRNGEWGTTPYNTKEAAQRAQNSLASRNGEKVGRSRDVVEAWNTADGLFSKQGKWIEGKNAKGVTVRYSEKEFAKAYPDAQELD
tara:strand:+ start:10477 stop:12021 length:1545 start_codon:yes stop_codon:yes gene_type:complete